MLGVGNVMQDELIQKMKQDVLSGSNPVFIEAEEAYLDAIYKQFPFSGSKINWSRVSDHFHQRMDRQNLHESVQRFLHKIIGMARLSENETVVVVGDGVIEVAVVLSVSALRKYAEDFVELPQHTYVVPKDIHWCACFTLEGDMDFGISSSKPLHS